MARGTRITVDLGSEDLLKSVKFAAVERGQTVREIVIESLKQWLEKSRVSQDKDFQTMIRTINEYRSTSK
jgi:hypothetical protein